MKYHNIIRGRFLENELCVDFYKTPQLNDSIFIKISKSDSNLSYLIYSINIDNITINKDEASMKSKQYIALYCLDDIYDHQNFSFPIIPYLQYQYYALSNNFTKNCNSFLTMTNLQTDEGLFSEKFNIS